MRHPKLDSITAALLAPPTYKLLRQLIKKNSPDNDFISDIDERVVGKTVPYLEEVVLAHPFHTSSLKFRNNGMIDIFVAHNQGIRIDPGYKTISNVTNGMKEDLGFRHAWVNSFSHWFINDEEWHVIEKGNYRLDVEMEIEEVTESYMYHEAIGDMGQVAGRTYNAESINDMNLSTFSNINETANGNINISAGNPPPWKNFPGNTVYNSSASNANERKKTVDNHTVNNPVGYTRPANINETATQDIVIRAGQNVIIEAGAMIKLNAPVVYIN